MSEWQCDVCNYQGTPTSIVESNEEWGKEVSVECPKCGTTYINGDIYSEAEGEVCAFCGEFVEEVVELNLGGIDTDLVCRECEEEHWK